VETKKKSIEVKGGAVKEKAKGEDNKKEEKPKSVAEKHQDNILLSNPVSRAMNRFVKSKIDFTGNEDVESAVLKKGVWMMNYSPKQH
jgi:hypothetical protein